MSNEIKRPLVSITYIRQRFQFTQAPVAYPVPQSLCKVIYSDVDNDSKMKEVLRNICALLPLTCKINEKLVSVGEMTVTLLDFLDRERVFYSTTTKPGR